MEILSTRCKHDHVVQYRGVRIGHLRQSTLVCPAVEEGRKPRASLYKPAFAVFVLKEEFLGLRLVQALHAEGSLILGKNNLRSHRHRNR